MVQIPLVLIVTLLLLLASAPADACDCTVSKPLSKAVRIDYPFIFEGKAVERQIPRLPQLERAFEFEVRRAWNGVTTKRISVSQTDSDCMFWFEIGHTYVVFAWKDAKGDLTTSHCSWTVESSKAAPVLAVLGQATVPK